MEFKIGQKVTFLHESGYGMILEFKEKEARVEDETGFDRWFDLSELVKIHSLEYGDKGFVSEKEDSIYVGKTHRVVPQKTGAKRGPIVWELDLHIDEILESTRGLSNTEMLVKQMSEFKNTFKKAKGQSIQRLIVIHGIGEGVLKNEVRMYLDKEDQVEYFDADFAEYGKGATEINFHPNWKASQSDH
jgi:hypothetical protein